MPTRVRLSVLLVSDPEQDPHPWQLIFGHDGGSAAFGLDQILRRALRPSESDVIEVTL